MKKLFFIFNILSFVLLIFTYTSCSGKPRTIRTDTPTSGVAEIIADECFAPIVQEQIDVFEALNDEATIIPVYTNERHAFELFMADSIRVLIASRELTKNEALIIKERKQQLRSQKYATDAIALIVNKANPDTLISVSDIKKIMTGKIRLWKELNPDSKLGNIAVTFDTPNSSTVRYIKDSICGGDPLGDNLRAVAIDSTTAVDIYNRTPNQQVVDYVASNPNALGIIGVNWVSNPNDSTKLSFIKNITVMSVSREDKATFDNSYKPFAAFLKLQKYPLSRDLYIMITDVRGGLPSGFVHFAAGERGQRIILKSGLLPAYSHTRVISVRPSL
ncbi:MAG: substrate-binding domain-containing protein [Prevotella sp.]|jgi:phosphate transport system substrate-binding protein|nr:substrate-binding domain-containing protein [Prevotella sp.]